MQSSRPSSDWEQNCTWQFGIVCVFLQPIWLFQQNHQQCCKVCVRSKVALIASVSAARSHKAWPPSLSVNGRLHRLSANIRRPSRTTPLRFEMDRLLLESFATDCTTLLKSTSAENCKKAIPFNWKRVIARKIPFQLSVFQPGPATFRKTIVSLQFVVNSPPGSVLPSCYSLIELRNCWRRPWLKNMLWVVSCDKFNWAWHLRKAISRSKSNARGRIVHVESRQALAARKMLYKLFCCHATHHGQETSNYWLSQ